MDVFLRRDKLVGCLRAPSGGEIHPPPPHSPPSPVPSSAPCGGILSRQRVGKLLDNGLTGPRPELQGVSVHCCKMEGSSDGAEEILDMNGWEMRYKLDRIQTQGTESWNTWPISSREKRMFCNRDSRLLRSSSRVQEEMGLDFVLVS